MTHIKKINEMSGNYTLRDIILGHDFRGKYQMTVEGLHAIYQALYRGEDVYGAIEFVNFAIDNGIESPMGVPYGISSNSMRECLMSFIYNKLVDDVSDEEILNAIYDGEHLNYINSRDDMFENFENEDYREWANEVANILGIVIKNAEYDD